MTLRAFTSLWPLLVAALSAVVFAAAAVEWELLSSPIALTTLALIALFALLLRLRSSNVRHLYLGLGFLGLGTAALAAAAVTARDYMAYNAVLDDVDTAIGEYRELAAGMINQTEVGDGDLQTVLQPLDKLRFMPLGYATQDEGVRVAAGYGLGQHERLRAASIRAYRDALDRLFLPRLIYRLEQLLEKNIQDTTFVYEGLKVYLMLGGQAALDEDLVRTWMARDWANHYPGAGNAKGRERLMEHLQAALERPSSAIGLNGPLVQEAQRTLARMPVADRAYTLMRTRAEAQGYSAWNAARGGPDAGLVFETRDGAPLSDVEVPGFFTYDGFHDGVLGQMDAMVERAQDDRWVLGDAGNQSAIEAQFATVRHDVANRYSADFIEAWESQLSRLKIASVGDGNDLILLSALTSPRSPLKRLVASVAEETELTRGAPGLDGTGREGRLGRDAKSSHGYGWAVESHFGQIHDFAGGPDGGVAPVDRLIERLNDIYRAMLIADDAAANESRVQLKALEVDVQRASPLIAPMWSEFIDSLVKDATCRTDEACEAPSRQPSEAMMRR